MSKSMNNSGTRAGFDIGGTFTDIIVAKPDGGFLTYKILSVPQGIGKAVARCFDNVPASTDGKRLSGLVHGTTVGSNALLEGKGAKAGLLTTLGFRDALEMRRMSLAGARDFNWERSAPLIPRRRRLEVAERIGARGEVLTPLDEEQTRQALVELKRIGIESLAICFVNAYVNGDHERRAAALAREILPDIPICLSCEVLPAYREYERTSTTAVNAYLQPEVARYLDSLEQELLEFSDSMLIMQSNGGVTSSAQARLRPIFTVESGPAAGVLAATELTRELSIERAVSFDMGGTTVKACLIEDSVPVEKAELEVGGEANSSARWFRGKGYTVSVPSFDIVEAGAGGGSIASVDENGTLRVGPQSAGAVPGPVCYGRGGKFPTVTDANVALGYLNPDAIAGGTVEIDRPAALAALDEHLASRLGLSVLDAAYGVLQVANAAMMRTVRAVTTERGRDPREYTLIAFGGGGPLHAAALAEGLGIGRVFVPQFSGLFSALGLLLADLRHDYVRSMPCRLDTLDTAELLTSRNSLLELAREDARNEGHDPGQLKLEWYVDLRYARQTTDLRIALPDIAPSEWATALGAELAKRFHQAHEAIYHYRSEEPIALVNLRLKATAAARKVSFSGMGEAFLRTAVQPQEEGRREAYFGPKLGSMQARVLRRSHLVTQAAHGPLIIEEFDTTVVVLPGWKASLDHLGNIVLDAEAKLPK